MNANELRTAYPDAVKAIEDGVKAEAASQIEEANNKTTAVTTNAAEVAEAMFGSEAGGKLKAALDANLNAEQINTLGLSMNLASKPENEDDAPDADANSRQKILNAIQANDQGGPAPGTTPSPAAKENPLIANMKARFNKEG